MKLADFDFDTPFLMDESDRKRWDYQMSNWKAYHVTETREDFCILLNILQANGENLDSLHDVYTNGTEIFCGICGFSGCQSDREVADVLFEFHRLFSTRNDLVEFAEKMADENEYESIDEFLGGCDFYRTKDGYVEKLYY